MRFIFKGFIPEMGFRVFAFEGVSDDQTRTELTVRADLSLIRGYGIRVQDLPLLCRRFLERRDESERTCTLTFTEEEMRIYANSQTEDRQAAERRKSRRTPPSPRDWEPWHLRQRQ